MSVSDSQQDEVGLEPPDEVVLSIKTFFLFFFCELQANSTAVETVQLDSGNAAKSNEATDFVLEESVEIPKKYGNGHGTADSARLLTLK